MPELTERQRNWAPWLGLLLALAAMLSNAGFFLSVPGSGPSVAEPGPGDCRAALRRDRRDAGLPAVAGLLWRQGRIASSILGVVVLLIFALAVFGHVHSRDLPASAGAPQVGQKAPDFTLADTSGTKVSLGQLLGKADSANRAITPPRKSWGTGLANQFRPPRQRAQAVLLVFYRGYW